MDRITTTCSCEAPMCLLSMCLAAMLQARDRQSGMLMAVKVYDLRQLGELNKVQLVREIQLHGAFVHR